jgi:sporulation protein YabP
MEAVTKKAIDDVVKRPHKLVLTGREELSMTGIEKVNSANENSISVSINGTKLVIDGKEMQVSKLDVNAGIIEVLGIINTIKYTNSGSKSAKNFMGRIFK